MNELSGLQLQSFGETWLSNLTSISCNYPPGFSYPQSSEAVSGIDCCCCYCCLYCRCCWGWCCIHLQNVPFATSHRKSNKHLHLRLWGVVIEMSIHNGSMLQLAYLRASKTRPPCNVVTLYMNCMQKVFCSYWCLAVSLSWSLWHYERTDRGAVAVFRWDMTSLYWCQTVNQS